MSTRSEPSSRWGWYALGYVLTLALLNLPSALLWFAPEWRLADHEYDWFLGQAWATAWLGDAAFLTGRWLHSLLFLLAGGLFARLIWPWLNGQENPSSWLIVWTVAGACFVSLAGLPWVSPDVFYYLGKGWQVVEYGLNPYTHQIIEIPNYARDPLFASIYEDFLQYNLNYGPTFQWLSQAIVWLGGGDPKLSLLLFKLPLLAATLGTGWAAHGLAKLLGRSPTVARLAAFAAIANPVTLFALLTCGHNDAFISLAIVTALWAVLAQRPALAGVLLALGVSIKYVPLLLLPVLFLAAINPSPKVKLWGNWPGGLRFLGAFIVSLILCHLPDPASWRNLADLLSGDFQVYRNNSVFLPAAISIAWMEEWHRTWSAGMKLLFILLAGPCLIRWWWQQQTHEVTPERYVQQAVLLTVGYLLLASVAIHEWYLCWWLPLAVVLIDRALWRCLLVLVTGFPSLVIWTMTPDHYIDLGMNLLVFSFCVGLAYWYYRQTERLESPRATHNPA